MNFLFIISTIMADISVHKQLQLLYTEQQTSQAYQTLMLCSASIEQKKVSHQCWRLLNEFSNSKHSQKVMKFFKNRCSKYNYNIETMKLIGCKESSVSRLKLQKYKNNDIYIDN